MRRPHQQPSTPESAALMVPPQDAWTRNVVPPNVWVAQAVLDDREDDLRRRVVVGLEQVAIAGIQRERPRDHRLRFSQRLGVLRRPGVDLRVQIDLGQQHGAAASGGAAIGAGARAAAGRPMAFSSLTTKSKISWRVFCGRRRGAECIVFGHQRDVAEQIDPVPVAERPEEPGLGPEHLDVRRELGRDVPLGQLGVGGLAQELVGQADLEGDPVIHRDDERVG